MKDSTTSARLPKHPRIWWSRIKTQWPFLVWLLAVVFAYLLFVAGVDLAGFIGHVETRDVVVSPAEDSKLLSIGIEVGQTVTNNQPVAEMDSALIDAEIAVNDALASENSNAAADRILSLYSRYQTAVTDAQAQLNQLKLVQGADTAELQATTSELIRLQKLRDTGMLADITVLSQFLSREAALKESVRLYPQSIRAMEQRLASTTAEFTSFRKWLNIESETQITQALVEQIGTRVWAPLQQVALLKQRRDNYTLRSPADGLVSHVLAIPGTLIAKGVPVATVVIATNRVIGFLPEVFAKDVVTGMDALILPRSTETPTIKATVEIVCPEIEALPTSTRAMPNQAMRGRRIYLSLPSNHGLLPGETVDIQLLSRTSVWLHPLSQLRQSV
ncbi:MAG: hypothetical protein WCP86_07975, partial [bacterium]